jgi:hypothetical protein
VTYLKKNAVTVSPDLRALALPRELCEKGLYLTAWNVT